MGLDQYAFIKAAKSDEDPPEPEFYWRKHAKLQEFMERLFVQKTGKEAGELNCEPLELSADDIAKLKADIEGGTMPKSPGGFFYGHQFQDESAEKYREQDLKFCAWASEQIAAGHTVAYSCWW